MWVCAVRYTGDGTNIFYAGKVINIRFLEPPLFTQERHGYIGHVREYDDLVDATPREGDFLTNYSNLPPSLSGNTVPRVVNIRARTTRVRPRPSFGHTHGSQRRRRLLFYTRT